MTKRFCVGFRGADGRKDSIEVYALTPKEARFVAIESHPWLKSRPDQLLFVLELR